MNNYEKLIEKKELLKQNHVSIYQQSNFNPSDTFELEIHKHESNYHYTYNLYIKYILGKNEPYGYTKEEDFISVIDFSKLINENDSQAIKQMVEELIDLQFQVLSAYKTSRVISSLGSLVLTAYFFFNHSTYVLNTANIFLDLGVNYLLFKAIQEGTHLAIKKNIINQKTFSNEYGFSIHKDQLENITNSNQIK